MVNGSFGFGRILLATLGVCAIAWAVSAVPTYRKSAVFANVAERMLSGDKFRPDQLNELRRDIDTLQAGSFRPSGLRHFVVIRARLAEAEINSGDAAIAARRLDELAATISASLAEDPAAAFVWLADYWLQGLLSRNADARLPSLRMSYLTGPNEGWIVVKRNSLALSEFSSLPPDLSKQVLGEFARLVQSGFYLDAAAILGGPGWPVREKLLLELAHLDDSSRRKFANVLESQNLGEVAIPGLDERPSRPY